MIEILSIARMGHRGDAIAETPAGAVYVPYALPGETVEVERQGDRARLLRVIVPSPDRIEPVCPHFGTCGGCAVQHWRTDAYRAWKRGLAVTALAQAGIEAPVADLVDAHGEGRRRARAARPARRPENPRRRLHRPPLVRHRADRSMSHPRAPACPRDRDSPGGWSSRLTPTGKPIDLQFSATDGGLDVDLRGTGPLNPAVITALAQIAGEEKLARLTCHGELVAQFAEAVDQARPRTGDAAARKLSAGHRSR